MGLSPWVPLQIGILPGAQLRGPVSAPLIATPITPRVLLPTHKWLKSWHSHVECELILKRHVALSTDQSQTVYRQTCLLHKSRQVPIIPPHQTRPHPEVSAVSNSTDSTVDPCNACGVTSVVSDSLQLREL